MSRISRSILWMLLAVGLVASPVAAQEERDWSVTVGLKAWYTGVSQTIDFPDLGLEADFGAAFTFQPAAVVRFGKFFGGLSFFTGSFEDDDLGFDYERTDIDLYGGYILNPSLRVLAGIKQLKIGDEINGTALAVGGVYTRPIGENLVFAASASLFYTFSVSADDNDDLSGRGAGITAEAGVGYPFGQIVPMLGFRVQGVSWTLEDDFSGFEGDLSDTLYGPFVQVSYTF